LEGFAFGHLSSAFGGIPIWGLHDLSTRRGIINEKGGSLMPAIYVCDLCGKHQPMEEQLTVVAREPDPEEWHFCEECSRVHIQPILDKAAEAKVGRGD
jgi:hypothetical protein